MPKQNTETREQAQPISMRSTKAEIFAALEIETSALHVAATHARELFDDLDRWKERASIFEARLARAEKALCARLECTPEELAMGFELGDTDEELYGDETSVEWRQEHIQRATSTGSHDDAVDTAHRWMRSGWQTRRHLQGRAWLVVACRPTAKPREGDGS